MAEVEVTSYSGYKYAQRPISFIWQGKRYVVEVVEREWVTPEEHRFTVRTEEGKRFQLAYEEGTDSWRIAPLSLSL